MAEGNQYQQNTEHHHGKFVKLNENLRYALGNENSPTILKMQEEPNAIIQDRPEREHVNLENKNIQDGQERQKTHHQVGEQIIPKKIGARKNGNIGQKMHHGTVINGKDTTHGAHPTPATQTEGPNRIVQDDETLQSLS